MNKSIMDLLKNSLLWDDMENDPDLYKWNVISEELVFVPKTNKTV